MTTMTEVVSFLLGEGELDGCHFGEKQPWHKGNFWWRTHLREAYQDHLGKGAQVPDAKEVPDYKDYYGETKDGIPKDYGHGYAEGWNACREAMLSQRGEVSRER